MVVVAVVCGLVIEAVLVVLTNFISGPGGAMGAPVPISYIRRGPVSSILEGSPAPTPIQVLTAWSIFGLDVALTAVPVYVAAARVGALAAALGALGGLILALGLAWVMYELNLPFVGVPIPIARVPAEEIWSLALWADCILLGALLLLPRFLGSSTEA